MTNILQPTVTDVIHMTYHTIYMIQVPDVVHVVHVSYVIPFTES